MIEGGQEAQGVSREQVVGRQYGDLINYVQREFQVSEFQASLAIKQLTRGLTDAANTLSHETKIVDVASLAVRIAAWIEEDS